MKAKETAGKPITGEEEKERSTASEEKEQAAENQKKKTTAHLRNSFIVF